MFILLLMHLYTRVNYIVILMFQHGKDLLCPQI